jgi:hypothetical protein
MASPKTTEEILAFVQRHAKRHDDCRGRTNDSAGSIEMRDCEKELHVAPG